MRKISKEKPARPKAHEFEGFKSKRGVIHVTRESLSQLRQEHDYVVVLFGAHVCADCSVMLRNLGHIAPEIHAKEVLVPFAYFLCESEDSYCEQSEKIAVAPTLRIYHKNMFTEYGGIKNDEGMARWLLDRLLYSSHDAADQVKEIRRLNRQSEVVVVLREASTFRQFHEFKLLTVFYEFGHFFYTKDEKVLGEFESICREKVGETPGSQLFIINPEDSKCYYLAGSFNYKRAMKFIIDHEKIGVTRFDENILRLQQKYQVPVTLFFTRDALNHPFYQTYVKVAEEFRNKMVFAYVEEGNLEDPLVKRLMNTLGVDRRSFPVIRVFLKQPNGFLAKWKYDGPLDKNKVKAWVGRLLARKLKPYEKAEPAARLAEENERSEIEKISAENFESKVEEEFSPVLLVVEGSEETCEDCSGLQQKVLEIRDKFRERHGKFPFKLLRLNTQLNEIKNWVFDSVPQLLFIRRNKNVASFAGEIETNKVISFIEEKMAEDINEVWKEDL